MDALSILIKQMRVCGPFEAKKVLIFKIRYSLGRPLIVIKSYVPCFYAIILYS